MGSQSAIEPASRYPGATRRSTTDVASAGGLSFRAEGRRPGGEESPRPKVGPLYREDCDSASALGLGQWSPPPRFARASLERRLFMALESASPQLGPSARPGLPQAHVVVRDRLAR